MATTHYQMGFGRGTEPICGKRLRTGRLTANDAAVTCTTCKKVIDIIDNPILCHCGAMAKDRGNGMANTCDLCLELWDSAGQPDVCPCVERLA